MKEVKYNRNKFHFSEGQENDKIYKFNNEVNSFVKLSPWSEGINLFQVLLYCIISLFRKNGSLSFIRTFYLSSQVVVQKVVKSESEKNLSKTNQQQKGETTNNTFEAVFASFILPF